ncbi:class I fructose-bisphosphate aldolase [Mangrovitalea sediminis]|uniref:class I fructose-bisphosphate aldolase n=1 Tax=Mangrovitalea sediminis TaxID=1982043 RepID=UPI000BE52D91|nr:class I fructose-bisphosphate aldolase [Mangrovitalea sediminis]
MDMTQSLQQTIDQLVCPGKGILAADESHPTIAKRFKAVGVESTEENRRLYRSLLFSTPELSRYLTGVILFEETLGQRDDHDISLPEVLSRQGIVPGIKVDKGKGPLPNAPGDMITYGLDGLAERLRSARDQGARFAKWREVYPITETNPTPLGISANAEMLARYAAVCQSEGIVPIVEPEVLIDGDHSLARCAEVSEAVLGSVFDALRRHGVALEYLILKPSMVTPGQAHGEVATPHKVAEATLQVLKRTVPAAVPSINFLSGGQTPAEATANLDAINRLKGNAPWLLSFSFSRALQGPAMETWRGLPAQAQAMQQTFQLRAKLNAAATMGDYEEDMEPAA